MPGDHDRLAAHQPAQEPRGRLAQLRVAARRRSAAGRERSRLPEAISKTTDEQPRLDEDRLAVAGQPERVDRGQVVDGLADTAGGQQQHRAKRHGGEAGDARPTAPARARAGQREPENEQPDQSAEPDRAGRQVKPVEARASARAARSAPRAPPRRGRSARPRRPAAPRRSRPARRPSGARARGDPPRATTHAATQNSAKHSSRSRIARPNAVTPNSGTSAPDVEHRAQRVVGGREVEVHRDRDQTRAPSRPRTRPRPRVAARPRRA